MSDGNSVQNGTQKKFERCTAKTKVKNLPMIFLSTLKQTLDIEDGWKLLAVQLGKIILYSLFINILLFTLL